MIVSYIYNIHNGFNQAYIYIWISKSQGVIYIGMTNTLSGSIGRAHGHFNGRGTFRKRFLENKGLNIETVNDLILLSFPLPVKLEYTGLESSYRESVEYLVMKGLQLLRGTLSPSYDVVSWHDRMPRRVSNSEIILVAKDIVTSFETTYSSL